MESFLSSLVTFTVIMDPPGLAAAFGALTAAMSNNDARKVAGKASIIGACILLFFGVCGASLLTLLGISLEAFRISGGLLLFVIAFRMLMGHPDQQDIQKDGELYSAQKNIAIFPLAIPLLAGPGCITAMILITTRSHDIADQVAAYIAMLIAVLVSWLAMLGVQKLKSLLGAGGILILERLMGILLAALAIQFIADGAKGMMRV